MPPIAYPPDKDHPPYPKGLWEATGHLQKTVAERVTGPEVFALLDIDFRGPKAWAVGSHPAQDNQHR